MWLKFDGGVLCGIIVCFLRGGKKTPIYDEEEFLSSETKDIGRIATKLLTSETGEPTILKCKTIEADTTENSVNNEVMMFFIVEVKRYTF